MAEITQERSRLPLTHIKEAAAHPSIRSSDSGHRYNIDVSEPWQPGATHKRFIVSLDKQEMLHVVAGWLNQLSRIESKEPRP